MEIAHSKNRFEQFSDGVFAIAITLLALDLHVPHLVSHDIKGGLSEILGLLPNLLTFILSFITVAIFWVNHHQLTQDMKYVHRRVLWMNILFLLFITLIPFGTNVASVNPTHPLAMMTYAFILFAGSVSFTILRYFVHRGLGEKRVAVGRSLVGPIVYLCAIISAIVFVETSYFIFAIPPLFYFLPKARLKK
jgi:uncharacterized membrane protein